MPPYYNIRKETGKMNETTKDLWVFVETNEDGTAKNVGLELLTPGKSLAAK